MVACLMSNELERACKDVVLAWWEVLHWYLSGGTEVGQDMTRPSGDSNSPHQTHSSMTIM